MIPQQELANNAYLAAEIHKVERGIKSKLSRPPKILSFVKNWEKVHIPFNKLSNLQMWVNPTIDNGTLGIYHELQSARIGDVSNNFESLQRHPNADVKSWLSTVDPGLTQLLIEKKRSPILLVFPACFVQGNILDGNHSVIAGLNLEKRGVEIEIEAIVGTFCYATWIRLFISSMIKLGDISKTDRLHIVRERLSSLNNCQNLLH